MKPLIDSKEICNILEMSYPTFHRRLREDPTFPVRKVGGRWKANPDELAEWFRNQQQGIQGRVVPISQAPRKRGRPANTSKTTGRAAGEWKLRIPGN